MVTISEKTIRINFANDTEVRNFNSLLVIKNNGKFVFRYNIENHTCIVHYNGSKESEEIITSCINECKVLEVNDGVELIAAVASLLHNRQSSDCDVISVSSDLKSVCYNTKQMCNFYCMDAYLDDILRYKDKIKEDVQKAMNGTPYVFFFEDDRESVEDGSRSIYTSEYNLAECFGHCRSYMTLADYERAIIYIPNNDADMYGNHVCIYEDKEFQKCYFYNKEFIVKHLPIRIFFGKHEVFNDK